MFSYSVLPTINNLLDIFKVFDKKKFDKNIKYLINNNTTYNFLSASSWSILLICKWKFKLTKKKINLWVPSYFCFSALRLLNLNEVNIIYYDIDLDLSVKYNNLQKCIDDKRKNIPDIILGVHYFGNYNNFGDLINFANQYESWVIEDATHCIDLTSNFGKLGDFVLISPYKNFALPNGAILIVNNKLNKNLKNNFANLFNNETNWKKELISIQKNYSYSFINNFLNNFLWILKKIIQKIFIYNKKVNYKDSFFINSSSKFGLMFNSPFISSISKKLLIKQIQTIEQIKIKKYIINDYYKTILNNRYIEEIDFKNKETNYITPYSYIKEFRKIDISKKFNNFIKQNFPVYSWPDLDPKIFKDKKSNALKFRISNIFFHNHQSYNTRFFNKFVKIEDNNPKNNYDIYQKNSDYNEWKNFYKDNNLNNVLQSYAYGETKKMDGWIVYRYIFYNKFNEKAYLQFYIKKYFFIKIIRINRGPIFSKNASTIFKKKIINKIIKYGNIRKFKILFFQPELPYNSININYFNRNAFMFNDYCKFSSILIRLNRNIEEIKKDFKYFWKYSLNKSLKLKVNTEIINKEDDFKLFIERYLQFKKINNFKGISSKILFKLFHNQNKYDKIFLLNSYYNSKYCGSICIAIHGKSATYIASIFNDHGKKYNINNLLLWRAIEYLQKLNIIYFDLGGVDLNENSGINFFKKGLGGNEYKLINESIFI